MAARVNPTYLLAHEWTAKVTSIGFLISNRQEGLFQLGVDWIKVALPAGQ